MMYKDLDTFKKTLTKDHDIVITRSAWTRDKTWNYAKELIKQGHRLMYSSRHWDWEWMAIRYKHPL